MWIALCVVSFVALVIGVYKLAREAFTPLVGLVAGALICTRFDFPFYAARGYIDIAYMALVVWAAVLEARSPRRGTSVLLLLALAGRPAPRGVADERPVLPLGRVAGELGRAREVRRAGRARARSRGPAATGSSPATSCTR